MGNAVELNKDNFEDKIRKGKWAVDFWTSWCNPCKIMAPHFESAAQELKGKVNFGKLNVEDNMEIAQKFEVISIPTMIIFNEGKEVKRTVGALDKDSILKALK